MSARFENYKIPLAAGSFILSLELLLLICCIYSKGDWFFPAGMAVLFGIALIVLPFLLPTLPLPETLSDKKASIYLITVVTLLLLLLLVCCIYMRGDWFPIAAVSVLFGLGLFILPVLLHQCLREFSMYNNKALLYLSAEHVFYIQPPAFAPVSDIAMGNHGDSALSPDRKMAENFGSPRLVRLMDLACPMAM